LNTQQTADKFNFWPEPTLAGILAFVGAFVTLALGSIPQQDVFQRVMSAKNENTAVRGAVLVVVCILFLLLCLFFWRIRPF
jgi:SSS family solute:Na+ symporter